MARVADAAGTNVAAVDVAYDDEVATVACVGFDAWDAATCSFERVFTMEAPAPYVPGEFYRRELPCILRALEDLPQRPSVVVIDGFVWLDAAGRPGLGAHLWKRLNEEVAVVGVAKSAFSPLPPCSEVLRGQSARPLYVSAAGVTSTEAAALVASMHGQHRVPTLLRRVDQLSRGLGSGLD